MEAETSIFTNIGIVIYLSSIVLLPAYIIHLLRKDKPHFNKINITREMLGRRVKLRNGEIHRIERFDMDGNYCVGLSSYSSYRRDGSYFMPSRKSFLDIVEILEEESTYGGLRCGRDLHTLNVDLNDLRASHKKLLDECRSKQEKITELQSIIQQHTMGWTL